MIHKTEFIRLVFVATNTCTLFTDCTTFYWELHASCRKIKRKRKNLTADIIIRRDSLINTSTTADHPCLPQSISGRLRSGSGTQLLSTSHSSVKKGSLAPRRNRTLAVSCIRRTVGRSIQGNRNRLGIPLPAIRLQHIFCYDSCMALKSY